MRSPLLAILSLIVLLAACAAPQRRAPDAWARALAQDWRLVLPEGEGPHPAAILLSGCDGVHDNMGYWARAFAAEGRAALIVDSHRPRGLVGPAGVPLACSAAAMRGPDRAGDVAVALDALADAPALIDASDVVLFGASHGGWAAMEFVARSGARADLPGLAAWPEEPLLMRDRLSAVVLLYPYCGFLNGARPDAWAGAPPTFMAVSGEDSVVSAPACLRRAEALRAGGAEVETASIEGADHAFDQRDKMPISPLGFSAEMREEARALVMAWLEEAAE